MLSDERNAAIAMRGAGRRHVEAVSGLVANAVINVRFTTSSISQGAAELFAYGTAVTVK